MSLLLRQECQKVLDTNGLADYHVRIDGCLVISGMCGKPLINIYGIKFSKNQPTKAERIYAVELLEEFLLTHKKQIQYYIKEYQKFKQIPRTIPVNGSFKIIGYDKNVCRYIDDGLTLRTPPSNSKETKPNIHDYNNMDIEHISNYCWDEDLFNDAVDYLKEYEVYADKEAALDGLRLKLNTCDI